MILTRSGAAPVDTGTREQLAALNEFSVWKRIKQANKETRNASKSPVPVPGDKPSTTIEKHWTLSAQSDGLMRKKSLIGD